MRQFYRPRWKHPPFAIDGVKEAFAKYDEIMPLAKERMRQAGLLRRKYRRQKKRNKDTGERIFEPGW